MHRPLGQQLEDRGADVAALTASSSAATPAAAGARAEAETATGVEPELEAAAPTEADVALEAGAGVVLAQMVTNVFAELAAGLPALLMKRAPIAGAEAEAESAGGGVNGLVMSVDSLRWWGSASCASDTLTIYRKLSRCNDYFRARSSMALTSHRAHSASVAWARSPCSSAA